MMTMRFGLLALGLGVVRADDPSGSWLSYAVYTDPMDRRITMLNTTWTVPNKPKSSFGSNAPGWWFGVQVSEGGAQYPRVLTCSARRRLVG